MSLIYGIHPPPQNHSWIVSTQLFEKSIMSPGVWNATLIFCRSSLCSCLSALSTNYQWWLMVWGVCAEVLVEPSARRETLLKRVKKQACLILPNLDCCVIWPQENGLSLFQGHFPTILPHGDRSSPLSAPLVNHLSCSFLKYLLHPPLIPIPLFYPGHLFTSGLHHYSLFFENLPRCLFSLSFATKQISAKLVAWNSTHLLSHRLIISVNHKSWHIWAKSWP